ncbi:MAG: hypothetical protein V4793_01645 [Paraburkholderia tropica]
MHNEIPPESRLWNIAQSMGIFQADAVARRPDQHPGEAKSFFVEHPFAPGQPNISIRFPGEMLNRVTGLDAHEFQSCVRNIANLVVRLREQFEQGIVDGRVSMTKPFIVELRSEIFDGIRE